MNMKFNQSILLPVIAFGLIVLVGACDFSTEVTDTVEVTVRGRVQLADGSPVSGAEVTAVSDQFDNVTATTDINGAFELTLLVERGQTIGYAITVAKSGLGSATKTISVAEESEIQIEFTLGSEVDEPEFLEVQNIVLISATPSAIAVEGSGLANTSLIVYQAVDGLNRPIDLTNRVTIEFDLYGPGGGERLTQSSAETDEEGRATTVLIGGTRSGVVQIIARAQLGDRVVESAPTRIIIQAGLPDQDHFAIGLERINFPALDIVNARLNIVVVVGDEYSNPVSAGTAVYFKTTAGNVQTSAALTDDDGVASVQLISLGKDLVHPVWGPGFGYVFADTRGDEGVIVEDSARVMLSGTPLIITATSSFNLATGASQPINFRVADRNGNPMAAGQRITVALKQPPLAPGEKPAEVLVSGDTDVLMLDTQSQNATFFSVNVTNTDPRVFNLALRIETNGPNGFASLEIPFSTN